MNFFEHTVLAQLTTISAIAQTTRDKMELAKLAAQWESSSGRYILQDFGITESVRLALAKLQALRDSVVFVVSWHHHLQAYMSRNEEVSIADIIENAYSSAESETMKKLDSILSGNILLSELSSWLDNFPMGFLVQQLPKELETLSRVLQRDDSGVKRRLKQIEMYNGIQSNQQAADLLDKLLNKLCLEKCRSEMDEIKAMVNAVR